MNIGFGNGSIFLDSANETYYAGNVVSGVLNFTLQIPTTFQGICVKFLGQAQTHWTETESQSYNGTTRIYEASYDGGEEYFNYQQYVAGSSYGPATTLNPGTYSYPFQYQLPFVVPSSFEGDQGFIDYSVTAFLEQAPGLPFSPPVEVEKRFTIVAPLDLNLNSISRNPIEFNFDEVYSCCLCESGPLSVQVKLPVSGYCPGQKIPVEIIGDNKSNVEVQKIVLSITKRVAYHSQRPPSDYELEGENLAYLVKGPVPCNTKRSFNVDIEVPAIMAPNLTNCSLINISYSFKVELVVSGCNNNSEDEEDIIIGSLPLMGFQDVNYVHPLKTQLPDQPYVPGPIVPDMPYQASAGSVNMSKSMPYPGQAYPDSYPTHVGFTIPNERNSETNAQPSWPNPSFPTQNGQYNASNASPYPGSNPPYPGSFAPNPPYPGRISPNPTLSPPYASNQSYPISTGFPGLNMGGDPLHSQSVGAVPHPLASNTMPDSTPSAPPCL